MKTYTELEEIGIVGVFNDDGLCIVTKDGYVWKFNPTHREFYKVKSLK